MKILKYQKIQKNAEPTESDKTKFTIDAESIIIHAKSVSIQQAENSKEITKAISDMNDSSDLTETVSNSANMTDKTKDILDASDNISDVTSVADKSAETMHIGKSVAADMMNTGSTEVLGSVGAGVAGLSSALTAAVLEILPVISAMAALSFVIDLAKSSIAPAIDGTKKSF